MTDGQDRPVKIEMVEWFDEHFYNMLLSDRSTRHLVGVTTVLGGGYPKPWLAHFRGKFGNEEADRRMNEKGDQGSRLHHAAFVHLNGGAIIYRPPWNKRQAFTSEQLDEIKAKYGSNVITLESQREAVMAYRLSQWLQKMHPLVVHAEETVGSLRYGLGGTIDAGMEFDDFPELGIAKGFYIVDYKTGREKPEDLLQNGAYAELYEEHFGTPVKGGIILYLDADRKGGDVPSVKVLVLSRERQREHFRTFQYVYEVWKFEHPNFAPEIFQFPPLIEPYGQADPTKQPYPAIVFEFVTPTRPPLPIDKEKHHGHDKRTHRPSGRDRRVRQGKRTPGRRTSSRPRRTHPRKQKAQRRSGSSRRRRS